jgi:hypothetical protein
MNITIVYPYRNRPIKSIKNSLNSLSFQSNKYFNVLFVDYGSKELIASKVKLLVDSYDFVSYTYLFTEFQPWNKSKAINYALRNLIETPYFFVADIDMVFHSHFNSILMRLIKQSPLRNVFFKVGFLDKDEIVINKDFDKINIKKESNNEATGLTLFHTESLKELQGFDEFYHFWGAEDTDVHVRLQAAGREVYFYDTKILMLHQWHPSYRSTERKKLTRSIQLSGVVQLNHQHLKTAITQKRTKVNGVAWGSSISQKEYEKLKSPDSILKISNTKPAIDHFLCFTIKQKKTIVTEYIFQLDLNCGSFKQKIKKIVGKKVPIYYTLKEINDLLLKHLISSPNILNYSYQLGADLKSISLIF